LDPVRARRSNALERGGPHDRQRWVISPTSVEDRIGTDLAALTGNSGAPFACELERCCRTVIAGTCSGVLLMARNIAAPIVRLNAQVAKFARAVKGTLAMNS